ncbi:polysaccharide deacetylase family protein [Rubrivivax sp. RP6-9]|uniref:polysaccharide deacetylase family protein n=1 Tax=Rubrivivax sp. RP6-9 TaxID=3415750 RepID=UPI003CC6456F
MSMGLQDRGVAGAARALAWAAGAARGARLSTLIFHRVLREPDPIFPLELDARRFERLMRIVAAAFDVLPLHAATARLASGDLPPRALTISFDDGYADNHDVALPILQRLGLPATIFIATSFLDGGRMWNDTVIECVRRTRLERLDLAEFGLPVLPCGSAAERRRVIDQLLPVVKYRPPADREPLLQRLWVLCGQPALPQDLMMRSDQVRALPKAGIDVGAHTVHHPILRTLPDDEARAEMRGSRERLQQILDAPVALFAYPNGRPGTDYDDRHAAMARSLGFAAAVSTRPGVAKAGDDLFQLPRFTPWEPNPRRWAISLALSHVRG